MAGVRDAEPAIGVQAMKLRDGLVALAVAGLLAGPAAAADPARRFIPVELWTGAPWDGTAELRTPPASLDFGKGNRKHIRGPVEWTRPGTGEKLLVYERTNRSKVQLFTLSRDGQGLGRVDDSRYERNCKDEVKFPLGWWREGETRRFTIRCNGGRMIRTIELTILDLDYRYNGIDHSLRYRWIVDGGRGKATDNIYSPGQGQVAVVEN